MNAAEIRVGQIWREADNRIDRLIRITCVRPDKITFRTCDERGQFLPGTRFSCALISRFGKAGGYRLLKDAETAADQGAIS